MMRKKKILCLLITVIMLLTLIPVTSMADEIEEVKAENVGTFDEPLTSGEKIQSDEPITSGVKKQSDEPITSGVKKQSDETRQEAVDKLHSSQVKTKTTEKSVAVSNEHLATPKEEKGGKKDDSNLCTPEELAALGIETDEPVRYLDDDTTEITSGVWTIKENVLCKYVAGIYGKVTIILPDDLQLQYTESIRMSAGDELIITTPDNSAHNGTLKVHAWYHFPAIGARRNIGDSKLSILSGRVMAYGDNSGAGIRTSSVTIEGGDVFSKSDLDYAGICADNVLIKGGKVKAVGGARAAGISGNQGRNGGNINITGGEVEAIGGAYDGGATEGAGIGGGIGGSGGTINITGGKVTATGSQNAAGIGGGPNGSGGTINITGGTVTATGGQEAAGIGGGQNGNNGIVNINGGDVTATGGVGGAGIGGGQRGSSGKIYISNSKVTATGGQGGAGIGGGRFGDAVRDDSIVIESGDVTAIGGYHASGIGGGENRDSCTVTINGGKVTARGGEYSAGIGGGMCGSNGTVTINNGNVTATGSQNGAGIGGGSERSGGNIIINGGTVTANGGTWYAAGIGGGYLGNGGNITVRGGAVTATGGSGGSGVGGGYRGSGGNITLSSGTVMATGGRNGAGIGGGDQGSGGTLIVNGDASIAALGGINGAGIGGGNGGNGGNVTIIDSAVVKAHGGSGARCIGRGFVTGRQTMGTLVLGPGMNVLDVTNYFMTIQVYNPTLQKLDSIRNVCIGKVGCEPVAAKGLVYNGSQQTGYLNPGLHLRVEGTTSAKDAGKYTFNVTPEPGYEWPDRFKDTKTLTWYIAKAKATVKANSRMITYGDKEPELTATVRGTIGRDQLTYQLTREQGKGVGKYTITSSGEKNQGNYDVSFENGTFTIRPKNVSENRGMEYQTITAGSGDFKKPIFHDKTLDEDITGKITYTYNGVKMSEKDFENALGALPPESRGTATWQYVANGNFTGTISGRINFRIESIGHTHRFSYVAVGNVLTAVCRDNDCPLSKDGIKLTLIAPKNLKYDGKVKEVSFAAGEAQTWKDATRRDTPSITYTADRGSVLASAKPVNAGSYTASISVNGKRASVRFTIAKADYPDVIKTASGNLNAANRNKVTINLPAIPRGTRYGTPIKASRNDKYSLSSITGNRIIVTSMGIPQGVKTMNFTVPVITDGNHNSYDITVTLNVIRHDIKVSVTTGTIRIGGVRFHITKINVDSSEAGSRELLVEYSLDGGLYIPGTQITSLNQIRRFDIRVTNTSTHTRYYYRYSNGKVTER